MSHGVLFDLESYPIDAAPEYVEDVSAPGNYKDPEKIAAYIAEARTKAIAKAALKPDLGRIVAIGWQMEDRDSEPRVLLCEDEAQERKALEIFWDDLTDGDHFKRLIGFNSHRFDMPMLMRRSLALRVEHPQLRVDRGSPHLDLYRLLTFDGVIDGYSLQFYLKRYGLDHGIEDDLTGADVGRLVAENRWADVKAHCSADVSRLYALASWMGAIDQRTAETEQPF